jgi:hypothetical protein
VDQDRRFPFGSPGSADGGALRDTALALKEEAARFSGRHEVVSDFTSIQRDFEKIPLDSHASVSVGGRIGTAGSENRQPGHIRTETIFRPLRS